MRKGEGRGLSVSVPSPPGSQEIFLGRFLVVDIYPEVVDLKHKNLDCNEKAPKKDFGGYQQTN